MNPTWLFAAMEMDEWRNELSIWLDQPVRVSERVAAADGLVAAARAAVGEEAAGLWRRCFWLQAKLVLTARRNRVERRRPQSGLLGVRKCFEARSAMGTDRWDVEFLETWAELIDFGLEEISRHVADVLSAMEPENWHALVREVVAFDNLRTAAWFPQALAAKIEAARLGGWSERATASGGAAIWRNIQANDEAGAIRCVETLFAKEQPWPAMAHARVWADAVLRRSVEDNRPRLTGMFFAVEREIISRQITIELPAAGYVRRALVREWYFRAVSADLDPGQRHRIARLCWPNLAVDEVFFCILDRIAGESRMPNREVNAVAAHHRLFAEIEHRTCELRNSREAGELRALARLMVACSWRLDGLSAEAEIDFVRKLGRRKCWLELRWLWLARRQLAEAKRREQDADDGTEQCTIAPQATRRAINTPTLRFFAEAAAALRRDAMLAEVAAVAEEQGFDRDDMDATWAAIITAASTLGSKGDEVLWRVFDLARKHHRPFVHVSLGRPSVRVAWSRHAEENPEHPVARTWERIRTGTSVLVNEIAEKLRTAPLRNLSGSAGATEFTGAARIAGRRLINAFVADGDQGLETELDAIVPALMLPDGKARLFALGELVTQNNGIFQGSVGQRIRRQLAREFNLTAIAAKDDGTLQEWCRNPLAVTGVFERIGAAMAQSEPDVRVQARNSEILNWVKANLVQGVRATYEPDLNANYLRGALRMLDGARFTEADAAAVRSLLRDWVRAAIKRTELEIRSMVRNRAHDAKHRLDRLLRKPIAEGLAEDLWVQHQLGELRQALIAFVEETRGRQPPPVVEVRLWPTLVDAFEEQGEWLNGILAIRLITPTADAARRALVSAQHFDALSRVVFELLNNVRKAVRSLPEVNHWLEITLVGCPTHGWIVRLVNPRPEALIVDPFSTYRGLSTLDPDLKLFVAGAKRRDSDSDRKISHASRFVTLLHFPHAKAN